MPIPMPEIMKSRQESILQLLRYGLVGVFSNGVGYCIYLLITFWGMEPKAAMSLLYVCGATVGYFGNRGWTFNHQGAWLGSSIRYSIIHAIGYAMNLAVLYVFVDVLSWPHQWVQAAAIFIVAAYLFVAFKFFVFSRQRHQGGDSQ